MSKEQEASAGSVDESQLKPEDEILQDTPVEYEEIEPLFAEEGVEGTEDETGEKAEEKTEEKPEDKAEEPGSEEEAAAAQPEGEKAEEPGKEEAKEPEAKVDEKPEDKDEKKPPPGYVEIGALHEARGQIKEMRDEHQREISSLRREISALKEEKEQEEEIPERFKDFKVLTEKEFDELAEDNPIEAIKYQQTLRDYEKYTDGIESAKEAEEAQAEADRQIIQSTMTRIGEIIPGVYEKDSEIRETLTKFATDNGISRATLGVLTDPGTLVLPPGADQPVLLGESAAELVDLINKIYGLSKTSDRATVEKDVEARLRKEIQAELVKKLKAGSLGDEFKDIGELPSGEDLSEEIFAKTDFTEEQWARLPESKKRALLGG